MKKLISLGMLIMVISALFVGCEKETLSNKCDIIGFMFESAKNTGLDKNIVADINGYIITANIPFKSDITKLIPSIEISPRATIVPQSNIPTDFSSMVSYTVTAENGSSKIFSINIQQDDAEYVGEWAGSLDFGSGLSRINLIVTKDGNITIEIKNILTNEIDGKSIKGIVDINSRLEKVTITQTHRWLGSNWSEETMIRAFKYNLVGNILNFEYYSCPNNEQPDYTINLTKQ